MQDKHYLCITASDTHDQNLSQYFSVCNDFIHAARIRDGIVLIHCLAGMSRSVTVAVAYIMSVTNLSWKEALKVVRTGRAVANPNLGFQNQLQEFEMFKLAEVCCAMHRIYVFVNMVFFPTFRSVEDWRNDSLVWFLAYPIVTSARMRWTITNSCSRTRTFAREIVRVARTVQQVALHFTLIFKWIIGKSKI